MDVGVAQSGGRQRGSPSAVERVYSTRGMCRRRSPQRVRARRSRSVDLMHVSCCRVQRIHCIPAAYSVTFRSSRRRKAIASWARRVLHLVHYRETLANAAALRAHQRAEVRGGNSEEEWIMNK